MKNVELRKFAKEHGVRLWEIADYMQISEPTMTRLLRRELDSVQRESFLRAVERIQTMHDERRLTADE